ncbi:hypothetical protein [Marinobacter sp.]|uniref:hypothetical protein n=1 Tax=Marinobacter sp. TaxID=50741 RepID=UPI0035685346
MVRTYFALSLVFLCGYPEVGLAQQVDPNLGAAHALKQVGGLAALIWAASAVGGLLMIWGSINRWMSTENSERETMGAGKLLAGLSIGTLAVILPFVVVIGGNSLFAPENPVSSVEFQRLAIDGSLAQTEALSIQTGPGKYVPAGALIAFYGILIAIGLISIYMGLRDAYVAVMFGNDMYGTSMPFKTGKILGHLFFGLGLIFINQTQCLLVLTFGGTQSMCW